MLNFCIVGEITPNGVFAFSLLLPACKELVRNSRYLLLKWEE